MPAGSFAHRCYAFTSYNQVKTVSETGTTLTYTYDEDHRRETVVEAGANPGFREYFPVAGVESERRVNHDSSEKGVRVIFRGSVRKKSVRVGFGGSVGSYRL